MSRLPFIDTLVLAFLVVLSLSAMSCTSSTGEKPATGVDATKSDVPVAPVVDAPEGQVSITPDVKLPKPGGVEEMKVTSSAFADGEVIPKRFTCQGENVSPALSWDSVPGAKTYAIIADDPDAPGGTWVHWLLWNQPAAQPRLTEGVPARFELPIGSRQGITSFRTVGYGGPCPPPGPAHRYHFKVYALDIELSLPAETGKPELLIAMKGHILDQGTLAGRFAR